MSMPKKRYFQRAVILIPVVIGVIVYAVLMRRSEGPERIPLQEEARVVRVIRVQSVDYLPRVVGYGYVEPARVWQAVAEVSGKVTELSSLLKVGALCREGTVLIRIATAEYNLAIIRMEANIQQSRAQLAELVLQEKNYRASLEIEEKSLQVSKKEYQRYRKLSQKGNVSSSEFGRVQQEYNAQLTKVQNLKNTLNLIPATRKKLQADLDRSQAQLAEAKLDLENTTIKAPFDCRITEVNVEKAQFVQKGQVLAVADGTDTAEIRAQVPIYKMNHLVKSGEIDFNVSGFDIEKMRQAFDLSAVVRLMAGDFTASWEGRVARMDANIDPQTRTAGVIVAVDGPYEKILPGIRPPLVRNMYCEVEIKGRLQPNTVVIPKSAYHQGIVYLMDSDKRLRKRQVEIQYSQSNFYALSAGLNPGEWVVASDLVPAIEGMLLQPVEDPDLEQKLTAEATGTTSVK